jgi:hypothetical protein
MKTLTLAVIALALGSSSAVLAQSKSTPLTGAWRATQRNGSDSNIQPSLFLFTGNHYSMMVVGGDKPRPALPDDLSKATSDQLRATYAPITANSGTYEIQGDTLIMHPSVAKNPNAMAPGSNVRQSFKIEGKTLTLGPPTFNQKKKGTNTMTLTRVE